MHFQVPDQVRLLRKPFIAVLAKKCLLPSVDQQVLIELPLGGEGLCTLIAMVVLFARVYFYVSIQVAGACKPFGAVGASVWSFRRVNSDRVFGELLCSGECFVAGCTYVVFFASVGAHVCVQVAPVYEPLVTQMTNVWPLPSVYPNMVDQAWLSFEHFAACVTLVLLNLLLCCNNHFFNLQIYFCWLQLS